MVSTGKESSDVALDMQAGELVIRQLTRLSPDLLSSLEEYGRAALGDSALNHWMIPVVASCGLLYVGQLKEEIVGVAEIIRCMGDRSLYLEGFYIRPEFQSLGYGSALIAGLTQLLAARGFKSLIATVDPQNGAARRLYQKAGFKKIDYLPDHYGSGRHRLVLSLKLPVSGTYTTDAR